MLLGQAGPDYSRDVSTLTDRLGTAVPGYPYGTDVGTAAGADQADFATYTKEGGSGMEYANQRYYSAGYGRFMTVDRYVDSGNGADPGSLNLFAYANNDPMNGNDPEGLCTVVLAGITQSPSRGSAITDEAESLGADSVYGYSGQNAAQGFFSVIAQGMASNNASDAALNAIRYALASNAGSVDILAYSGGAGAYTAAFSHLSQSDKARIGLVLYVSPGVNGEIAVQPGKSTTVIEGQTMSSDPLAMVGTMFPINITPSRTSCDHIDVACLLRSSSAKQVVNAMAAKSPCNKPKTYSQNDKNGVLGFGFHHGGGVRVPPKTGIGPGYPDPDITIGIPTTTYPWWLM